MEYPVNVDQDSDRRRPVPAPTMHAHLEASVKASADAIIGLDRQGAIIAWNPAAERLFGFTAREPIGQSLIMLITPQAPDIAKLLIRALSGQDVKNERIRHVEQTGPPRSKP